MSDIEKAYRTLGLETGASIKGVREAHRDLCLVWDASRFDDNPQIQKKALDQLGRIDEAFERLRVHHGGAAKPERTTASRPPLEKGAGQPADQAQKSQPGAPSLYEEIFQGKQDETGRRLPVGIIIAAIAVLVVLVICLGGPADQDEAEGSQIVPAIEEALTMDGPMENFSSESGDSPSAADSDLDREPVELAQDSDPPDGSSSQFQNDAPVEIGTDSQPSPRESSRVENVEPEEVPVVEPAPPEPSNKPVLQRDPLNLVEETQEPAGQEVGEDEASNQALEILKGKSVVVRQLIEGEGVPGLSYQEWKTVRHNPPEFWIDVVTQQTTDSGELHLIWSVNTETGGVSPLSQAARDVEPDPLPQ